MKLTPIEFKRAVADTLITVRRPEALALIEEAERARASEARLIKAIDELWAEVVKLETLAARTPK